MHELARWGGFAHAISQRLADAAADVAQRVVLTAALHCAESPLLLLDKLPAIADPQLRRRAGARVRELLRGGSAIMQRVDDPRELLTRPDRLMLSGVGA